MCLDVLRKFGLFFLCGWGVGVTFMGWVLLGDLILHNFGDTNPEFWITCMLLSTVLSVIGPVTAIFAYERTGFKK
jgi:hypothetical protein